MITKIPTTTYESSSSCDHVCESQAWLKKHFGGWEELRDRFCLVFFPISRIASLQKEILDFRQDEKETLGAAWEKFTQLTHIDLDLSIPDHVLLQHFWLGLNKESALQLDISTGGSFAFKTTSEG